MRFVAAIISFVIALILIGYGIGQRTVLAGPDSLTSAVTLATPAPITVIDGEALNSHDGSQKLHIEGKGGDTVFAAYGRTGDLVAWAGDTSYNYITADAKTGLLSSEVMKGTSTEAPAPAGSDLWLAEYTRDTRLDFSVKLPEDVSIIVLTDGVKPAPASVSVTWPLDSRAPWSGPLIVGGILILLLGLGLYLWGLTHLRKARGPRRKPPTQPKLPQAPKRNYRQVAKAMGGGGGKAIENPRGRRSATRMVVVPTVLVGALLLSGCTADDWPDFSDGSADTMVAPTATAESNAATIVQAPVVTVSQLEDIVTDISEVATEADASLDSTLIESRFTGAALQLRQANYAIRSADSSIAALAAIPAGPVELALPQQSTAWPRVVFTVIQESEAPEATPAPSAAPSDDAVPTDEATDEAAGIVPTALMLVQETPRDNFKVAYAVTLEASVTFPDVALANVGAVRQSPDYKMLKLPPGQVADAYADIMTEGANSQYFELFDFANDVLLPAVGADAKAARIEKMSTTTLSYASVPGVGEPIALSSSNSGAIVAVSLGEVETVAPKEAGSILSPAAGTKALSGLEKTTKGVSATYGYQLVFYVPPATSDDKIVLLGFGEGLVDAKEIA